MTGDRSGDATFPEQISWPSVIAETVQFCWIAMRREWRRRTWYGKLWYPAWLLIQVIINISLLALAAFIYALAYILYVVASDTSRKETRKRTRLAGCRRCTRTMPDQDRENATPCENGLWRKMGVTDAIVASMISALFLLID